MPRLIVFYPARLVFVHLSSILDWCRVRNITETKHTLWHYICGLSQSLLQMWARQLTCVLATAVSTQRWMSFPLWPLKEMASPFLFIEQIINCTVYCNMTVFWVMFQLLEEKLDVVFQQDGTVPIPTTQQGCNIPEWPVLYHWIGWGGHMSFLHIHLIYPHLDFLLCGYNNNEVFVPPTTPRWDNLKRGNILLKALIIKH